MRNANTHFFRVLIPGLIYIIFSLTCILPEVGNQTLVASCGDGICSSTETTISCARDCPTVATCGDGTCSGAETTISCPTDCTSGTVCDPTWPPSAVTVTTDVTNLLTVVTTGDCIQYLSVYLYGGVFYDMEWDDLMDGTGVYTGDSLVTVYNSSGSAITNSSVSPNMNSGWSTFQWFQPATSGLYYIGIDAVTNYTGTTGFRIYDDVIYMANFTQYYMRMTNENRLLCFSPTAYITANTILNIYLDDYWTFAGYTGSSEAYIFGSALTVLDGPFYSSTLIHSFAAPVSDYYYICVGPYNSLNLNTGTAGIWYY